MTDFEAKIENPSDLITALESRGFDGSDARLIADMAVHATNSAMSSFRLVVERTPVHCYPNVTVIGLHMVEDMCRQMRERIQEFYGDD